jgi:dTDP-D-glucose 4,6-dehydratase
MNKNKKTKMKGIILTGGSGTLKTIQWYLDNKIWCNHMQDGSYKRERLGVLVK